MKQLLYTRMERTTDKLADKMYRKSVNSIDRSGLSRSITMLENIKQHKGMKV